jgi:hypothetical protein
MSAQPSDFEPVRTAKRDETHDGRVEAVGRESAASGLRLPQSGVPARP